MTGDLTGRVSQGESTRNSAQVKTRLTGFCIAGGAGGELEWDQADGIGAADALAGEGCAVEDGLGVGEGKLEVADAEVEGEVEVAVAIHVAGECHGQPSAG